MKEELELIVKLVNFAWQHYELKLYMSVFHNDIKELFKDTPIEFKYIAGTDTWELKTEDDIL